MIGNKSCEISVSARLYIFLTHSVVKIGGAEIYLRNKCNYLKKKGWDVLVFSNCEGEIMIEDLKEYEPYILSDLRFVPFLYSRKRRKKIMDRMLSVVGEQQHQEIIIESNNMQASLWGELIAMQLQAKHLFFDLQEDDTIKSKGMFSYLQFKHRRKELVGITDKSLPHLFAPYLDLPLEEAYYLPAYCTNPIEDVECRILQNLPSADYYIASLGRLEKPYLQTALADICEFISRYPDKTFNLMFIGGERLGSHIQDGIRKMFARFPNVYVFITGFLFPIPLSLIRKADVYLSSAASARITSLLGIPTISYDAKDLHPIGIMGKTTHHSLFRESEPIVKGSDLLSDILIDKKYSFSPVPFAQVEYDFSSHLEHVYSSSQEIEYFDFSNYESVVEDKMKFWAYRCLGYRGYEMLARAKQYIVSKKMKHLSK